MKRSAVSGATRGLIDASSAILLYKAGLIDIFCRAVPLIMTRAVFEEVTVPQQAGAGELGELANRQPGVVVLDDPRDQTTGAAAADIDRLDRGERDTLRHYLNGAARFVIIDDGKAVRVCGRHAIPHVNALLVPKLLLFSGHLSAGQTSHFFHDLCSLGRYSDRVVAWAHDCGAGQLDFFLLNIRRME